MKVGTPAGGVVLFAAVPCNIMKCITVIIFPTSVINGSVTVCSPENGCRS